ncbi:hypothetical protein EP331_10135 [bacterium]|nr:MAG: hypothetical protein EP331_10135 [bacterium]
MGTVANTVAYSSIKDQLQTGDIILFHGPSAESVIIEKLDQSPFSHVGIVVLLEGTDHNRPLFWESSTIQDLDDFLAGKVQGGVHLVDLESVLDYAMSEKPVHGQHYQFAWRKLDPGSNTDILDKMLAFMRTVDGDAFPSLEEMAIHFAEGRLDIKCNMSTFFCSELASDTYMNCGLLTTEHLPNYYSPGSFSKEHYELKLLNGAQHVTEQYFQLDKYM